MKLYYSPGSCSLSPHIVLREAGLEFTPVLASLSTHKLQDGTDFYSISATGMVPLLELPNGERLSEGPAIIQYIADQVPGKRLAPANGTMERYRVLEASNFITSEIHKSYSPLFNPAIDDGAKAVYRTKLRRHFELIDRKLQTGNYLVGDNFGIADAYLFTVTRWAPFAQLDLGGLGALGAFVKRIEFRPAVQAALKAEGLIG